MNIKLFDDKEITHNCERITTGRVEEGDIAIKRTDEGENPAPGGLIAAHLWGEPIKRIAITYYSYSMWRQRKHDYSNEEDI